MAERRNKGSFIFSDCLGEKGDPKYPQTLQLAWTVDFESRTARGFPQFWSSLPVLRALVRKMLARRAEEARLGPPHSTGHQGLGCRAPSVLHRGAELGREGT